MSENLITIDDIINANRSPPLSPAHINYRIAESPPPNIDLGARSSTPAIRTLKRVEINQTQPSVGHLQPSLSDSFLIGLLGPDYPEVASRARLELISAPSEADTESQRPQEASRKRQMVGGYAKQGVHVSGGTEVIATGAAFEASQKLNAAISGGRYLTEAMPMYQSFHSKNERSSISFGTKKDQYTKDSPSDDRQIGSGSPSESAERALDVKPPPRITLPSIMTTSPETTSVGYHRRDHSMTSSPTLAKYSMNGMSGHLEQQLPRMQISPTIPYSGVSNSSRQTLPSLETALSAISAPSDATFSAQSASISRTSPAQSSYFGPSPSTYSNPSPANAISPPRLPTAPVYWRTTSRETTNSTSSEYASATASNGVSTPASSVPARSPSQSAQTPAAIEHDNRHVDDVMSVHGMTPRQNDDGQYTGVFVHGSFKCTFPGCNAPPFQTQYLLNSHTNVHSNTRPHFCPVENCPRGPGGQGFKRKNEMIRHGLVHQSPGYVCPFCPDQQHKYPRPDNLQRHVRVHHVDRDRDDPLLREVLAQRPEGGNRGRRRRLGS